MHSLRDIRSNKAAQNKEIKMTRYGTINDVYEAAKSDSNGTEPCNLSDPEVRYYGGQWALESALGYANECEAMCSLDAFQTFFNDSFSYEDYEISSSDEAEFLEMIKENTL